MNQDADIMDAQMLRLRQAGISQTVAAAVLEIDALLQNWRRQAARRELGRRALVDLKVDLELAQLDVLVAIEAPTNEFGINPGETMIATIAERLGIDPSRASRLVSEMVEAGYARRAVSQADARRTIIELNERGKAVVEAVRAYKFLVIGDFLSDWDEEALKAFVPMLHKFSTWSEHTADGASRFGPQIEELARRLAEQAPQTA